MSTSVLDLVGSVPPEVAIPILKAALRQARRDASFASDAMQRVQDALVSGDDVWPDMSYVSHQLVQVIANAHHAYAQIKALRFLTVNLLGSEKTALVFPETDADIDAHYLAAKGGA